MTVTISAKGPRDPTSQFLCAMSQRLESRVIDQPSGCRHNVLRVMSSNVRNLVSRRRVERFIEHAYYRQFGSAIVSHYPTLMSLERPEKTIIAALGIRRATCNRLFLEQYFEQSIEHLVSEAVGKTVDREAIIEIGNLASRGRMSTARLIVATAGQLSGCSDAYAVVTATEELRKTLTSFGFAWTSLGPARAQRLPDLGHSWGLYYQHDPQVVVGVVGQALGRMREYLFQVEVAT
jgi:Thermostable hemolysin